MSKTTVKIYVVTGFIGSGKTTALIKIMNQYENRRVGVVQHHDTSVHSSESLCDREGLLLRACPDDELTRVLGELATQDLEYLFVECSGLSDPAKAEENILEAKRSSGGLYELCGIICMIDANSFMEQKDLEAVQAQLKHCHLAVLNKADLVSPELLDAIQQQVQRVNPFCDIVSCSFGGFDLEFLDHNLLSYRVSSPQKAC